MAAAQAAFDPFAFDWDEQKNDNQFQFAQPPPPPPPPPQPRRLSGVDNAIMNTTITMKKKRQTSKESCSVLNDLFPSMSFDDDAGLFKPEWSIEKNIKANIDSCSAKESNENIAPDIIPADEIYDIEENVTEKEHSNECKLDFIPVDECHDDLDGVVFNIHEQMSVTHKSQSEQCTVKVCGSMTVAPSLSHQHKFCSVNFGDPKGHVESITSNNTAYARKDAALDQSTDGIAFQVIIPESNTQLLEYACSEKLCPVPLLVKTSVLDCSDHSKMLFQLMVNPRNSSPLVNGAVVISVPFGYDGQFASVHSVGRSIGKGVIDSNWSDMTRLLSWQLGELYSGAICEFEVVFPTSSDEDDMDDILMSETISDGASKFPLLLRYDSEGSLLSEVDVNCGKSVGPTFKKGFRVYHREI